MSPMAKTCILRRQRVRKVWVHNGITEERIYLGGFEVYRRHENGGVVLVRQTLQVMDGALRIAMVMRRKVSQLDSHLLRHQLSRSN